MTSVSHKYSAIIDAVQRRIEDGTYPPGVMMPTEAELVREFGASRSTVVRALEFLRQYGWVQGVQGRGRVVLGRPVPTPAPAPARVRRILDLVEASDVRLLYVGPGPAPDHIATALALPIGIRVATRRRRRTLDGSTTVVVDMAYLPPDVAQRAGMENTAPIRVGLLRRLERRGLLPHEVAERISARPPSAQEATLLRVGRHDWLFAVLHVVSDRAGRPLLAIDTVIPAAAASLEATFALL